MATTYQDYGDYSFMPASADQPAPGARVEEKHEGMHEGILARLAASFIASREAWARDAVDAHLSTLSNAELVKLGLTDERIIEVRHNLRARQANWL